MINNKTTLCLFLFATILFTTSCKKKEHDIIYLVNSLQDCIISYKDEFGKNQTVIYHREIGGDDWKMNIHFVPSLFDQHNYNREIYLNVSVVGDITNTSLVEATIFVDNKKVKSEFHCADENLDQKLSKEEIKNFPEDIELNYIIPKTFLEKYIK